MMLFCTYFSNQSIHIFLSNELELATNISVTPHFTNTVTIILHVKITQQYEIIIFETIRPLECSPGGLNLPCFI